MGRKHKGKPKFWSMKGVHKGTGVVFESGFEKKFLDQCWMQGIKVTRCKVLVPYTDATGKAHTYEPDFYLPDFNYVVEVKGAWAFKDNHGNVREKFFAAAKHFEGRYTLVTERELRGDFVARLHKGLVDGNGI